MRADAETIMSMMRAERLNAGQSRARLGKHGTCCALSAPGGTSPSPEPAQGTDHRHTSIDERLEEATDRRAAAHWEGEAIAGAHGRSAAITPEGANHLADTPSTSHLTAPPRAQTNALRHPDYLTPREAFEHLLIASIL